MNQQTLSARIPRALMICLLLAGSPGCTRPMLAGLFVESGSPAEIAMLRLVESPPGHLSGSLVVSSLNQDGSRKKDSVYNVTGSIDGSNVSLQLDGGWIGLASSLGARTNLVGSLSSDVLTLGVGNDTTSFRKMPQQKYIDALAGLDKVGQQIAMVEQSNRAIKEIESSNQKLNSDLKLYVDWGQARIDHVADVRGWYAERTKRYTKCLQTIRPLAERHVPSWRWQDCVLTIENDKYARDQESNELYQKRLESQRTSASLDVRIADVPQQMTKALNLLEYACPFTKDFASCKAEAKDLRSHLPDIANDKTVVEYRAIAPRVQNALDVDFESSSKGENTLSNLAREATSLYQSASSN